MSGACMFRQYNLFILHRSTSSKVYPAMYIENLTELAFDDVVSEDPDFPCIQGIKILVWIL